LTARSLRLFVNIRAPEYENVIRQQFGVLPFVVTGWADEVRRSHAMTDDQTAGFSALLTRRTDRPSALFFACLLQHEESMPEPSANGQLDRQDVGQSL
jgi:hypothetical protein